VSTVARRLQTIMERGGLDFVDVARILDTNPRTVARWAHGDTDPRWSVRERLLELFAVMERLQQVVRPSAAHDWMHTPNRTLDNEKPVDLLRRGEARRVLAVIDALGEGVFV